MGAYTVGVVAAAMAYFGDGDPEVLHRPAIALDHGAAWLAWAPFGYGSWAVGIIVAMVAAADWMASKRLYFAVFVSTCVCAGLYALAPSHLHGPDALVRAADWFWLDVENRFPALPVAVAWSLALVWFDVVRGPAPLRAATRLLALGWAVVVSAAAFYSLQHGAIDIAAGAAVGAVSALGVKRLIADVPAADVRPLTVREEDLVVQLRRIQTRCEAHQWSLDEVDWRGAPTSPLARSLVRLINQVVYIEEIAARNFALLAAASEDPGIAGTYRLFAQEEVRHAEGLRRLLKRHGHELEPPGLGASMVLDQFDTLDPSNEADVALVALATPVFEVFLDGGTIPFIQKQPAVSSDALNGLVQRINRDEALHLAMDWHVSCGLARRYRGWSSVRFLFNPTIARGMMAVAPLAMDVHVLAYDLGFDFLALVAPFRRVWRMHRRFPDLHGHVLWQPFRLFVLCGLSWALFCAILARLGLLWGWFWTGYTSLTDAFAWALFGPKLLRARQLPNAAPGGWLRRMADRA